MIYSWVIVLAACGGGGASNTTNRASTTSEPPQVVAARAKRDAICACTDPPCVDRVLSSPLGREVEGPEIKDPAVLRLMIDLGGKTLECLYRVAGVPAACLAMVHAANALTDCPALTEAQVNSLDETVQATTGTWREIEWRTLPAEQVREYERVCEDATASIRGLARECPPPSSGSKP